MIRISIPWIVQVTQALDGLTDVTANSKISDCWFLLFNAKNNIESLNSSVYNQHIKVSRDKAIELLGILDRLLNSGQDQIVTDFDAWALKNEKNLFSQILFAELGTMPAYLVSRKEGYDVEVLVEYGIRLFPPTLLLKVPEAEQDALQAGKALAFEVATGCGFHVFRVTESVLRRYWDTVSGNEPRPNLQTLGSFVGEMEKRKIGDTKVIESIKQMARLHRNPIIHPEVILTVEEAIGIIGIARSIIGVMLTVLPDVPLTTGA